MLPPDAFLRHLPVGLAPEQRFRFEALVFAADAMTVALARLRAITSARGIKIAEATDEERAAIFSDCWTIVDQVHVVRQILTGPHFGTRLGPKTSAYIERHRTAWALRNQMDHLNQRIPNIAAANGYSRPLFGAVSYFYIPDDQIVGDEGAKRVTGGHSLLISAGSSATEQLVQVLNPAGRAFRPPTCLFRLEAFDEVLEIEDAVESLRPILENMDGQIRVNVTVGIEAEAKRLGVPATEAMHAAASNLTIVADIAFDV